VEVVAAALEEVLTAADKEVLTAADKEVVTEAGEVGAEVSDAFAGHPKPVPQQEGGMPCYFNECE